MLSQYRHTEQQLGVGRGGYFVSFLSEVTVLLCGLGATHVGDQWIMLDGESAQALRTTARGGGGGYFFSFCSEVTVFICGLGATHVGDDVRW